ncbi:MAG: hypothetical protein JNK82_07990 [Myxococcaceae bacterium]|nr:hypothetical protein [Myxococcaceae bacterium]
MMRLVWCGAVLLSAAACIVPAPTSEKQPDRQKAAAAAAPPVEVRNGANFEDKVELVGATLAPGRVAPGEALRVTAFFKVLDALPDDYMIFVHVEDVDGRVDRLNADHSPVQGSYPTSKWKKGETVKDEFTIYVPPGMAVRGLNLLIGFWDPKTDARLKLKNVDAVRHDNNNRILLAQVPVAG